MIHPHLSEGAVRGPSPEELLTDFGFSIFPVKNKRPIGKWKQYQSTRATIETLHQWQQSNNDYGIVTGRISGVVVVDTDTSAAEKWAEDNLPPTPLIVLTGIKDPATGFRGRHRYYRYPNLIDSPIGCRASIGCVGLDLRGQGGYVVAPGSSHSSGVCYEVTNQWVPGDKKKLPPFDPAWFGEPVNRPGWLTNPWEANGPTSAFERGRKWLSKKDIPSKGERNNVCYSAACSLFDHVLSSAEVVTLMLEWNQTFPNPLSKKEIRQIVASAETKRQPPRFPKGMKAGKSSGQYKVADEGSWGQVTPISSSALPTFPLEVFAPWARDYLQAVTRSLQTPPDFAGMFFLGGLAVAFQKRFQLTVRPDWQEPLPLWVLLAAPSGSKKSQAFKKVMKPFNAWQNSMKKEFIPIRRDAARRMKNLTEEIEQLKKSKKGPANVIADKEGELDELFIPATPRLFTGSGTPEAIESKLEEHFGRYALVTAESDILSVLMGKYRSGGSPPIEGFLSGWSGEDLRNDFRTRDDVDVTEAHLSMVLATQAVNAADLYGQKKLGGRGAYGRFLTVLPTTHIRDEWVTEQVPTQVERAYLDGVSKLLPSLKETLTTYCERRELKSVDLCFSRDAQAAFRPFYERVKNRRQVGGDLQFLEEWTPKVRGQCARIAALLHLSDRPGESPNLEVPALAVERAVYLIENYLIPHAKNVFGSAVTGNVEKVWSVLRDFGSEKVTRKELGRKVKPMAASELTAILEVLEERNCIRTALGPSTGGRPPTLITLNPSAPNLLTQSPQSTQSQ